MNQANIKENLVHRLAETYRSKHPTPGPLTLGHTEERRIRAEGIKALRDSLMGKVVAPVVSALGLEKYHKSIRTFNDVADNLVRLADIPKEQAIEWTQELTALEDGIFEGNNAHLYFETAANNSGELRVQVMAKAPIADENLPIVYKPDLSRPTIQEKFASYLAKAAKNQSSPTVFRTSRDWLYAGIQWLSGEVIGCRLQTTISESALRKTLVDAGACNEDDANTILPLIPHSSFFLKNGSNRSIHVRAYVDGLGETQYSFKRAIDNRGKTDGMHFWSYEGISRYGDKQPYNLAILGAPAEIAHLPIRLN
jgi:hypothetical protein